MAGRGMGAATRGGGCVGSGPRNKKVSSPSPKVEVMMAKGGMARKTRADMPKGNATARQAVAVKRKKAKATNTAASSNTKGNNGSRGIGRRATEPLGKNTPIGGKNMPMEPIHQQVPYDDPGPKNPKKKMGGGMIKKYRKGGMSKKTRADMPTGGRTRSVGIGGDTSRTAMRFKKNHPGVVKSLGYSKGGKVKGYRKGGMCK